MNIVSKYTPFGATMQAASVYFFSFNWYVHNSVYKTVGM